MSGGNGNPKDFVGASKAPTSTLSRRVLHELGLAMLEGECKYWRHNYRAAPVRATVYLDALDRHMSAWIEGQEIDPASGLSHLVKAMACLMIIRDAQTYGSLIDDRPPAQADHSWLDGLNAKAKAIVETHAHVTRGAYTEANRDQWPEFSAALSRGPILRDAPPAEAPRVIETTIAEPAEAPPAFEEGSRVEVVGPSYLDDYSWLGETGRVLSGPDNDGEYDVSLPGVRTWFKPGSLRLI